LPGIDPAFFWTVVKAYDSWTTRLYLMTRYSIIARILADLLSNLPQHATVLNLGSGIGLFDLYAAYHRPQSRFVGVDIDRQRIELSRLAATRLGLTNVEFIHGDVTGTLPDLAPDVIVALDVLHHVSPEAREKILDWCGERLPVGGVCFIKDISTATPWKVTFTKVLDDMMTGWDPVYYFPIATMRAQLEARGMHTTAFHLWDYIPFPHVIYVARKWR
jgi:cyclopropane fatty-acyl-phospholipid synthase-like methyltransferase